ncbi:MAG TPA: DUF2279 domain-containing protein [Puia sp.]|nr:DUF2279 domain-containing protein [Puia sp.]
MTKLSFFFLKNSLLLIFFLVFIQGLQSQTGFLEPANVYNARQLRGVAITEIAGGILITTGLYYLWYRKHPRTAFHFFNDNAEWLQMDKLGHATTAYNIAAIQYDLMRWCGVKNDASVAIGSLTALGYMSIIEVLDGFSSKWGFSPGDMAANLIGSALFAGQQKGWGVQRLSLKFSYHNSIYAEFHPDELGKKLSSRFLKDYNGQTYWLSLNLKSFFPSGSSIPSWLNISAGYGADGMIGARGNPEYLNGRQIPYFQRSRKFFLAPDIDLFRVNSSSHFFNAAAYFTRILKFPAPALEWNNSKAWKFHLFYF